MAAAGNNAAAEAAARLQQNLQADSMKTVLRIPFFYGEEKEDALKVTEFIERFETSTTSMGLTTDAQKAAHFGSYLRGSAYQVHRGLDCADVDENDWPAVKAYFLEKYRGEFTAHATALTFEALKQKKGEGIMTFYSRVIYETKLYATGFLMPREKYDAPTAALPDASKAHFEKIGESTMQRMIAKTFFIAGIKPSIRTELQRIAPAGLDGTLNAALKLEQTENKEKEHSSKIAELADMDDEELAEYGPDQDTISKINGYRAQRGQQSFKKPYKRGNGSDAIKCRYCKIPGHNQKICYKRIAKNAPMVDEKGKPYANQYGNNKVHTSKEENDGANNMFETSKNWN